MINCKTCKQDLSEDKFQFRKDTQKYHPDCKKCKNSKEKLRRKAGLVKKRVKFNYACIECKTQKEPEDFYIKDKKTGRCDSTCKECRKSGAKKWHIDNRTKSIENKKKWHEKNRDKVLVRMRKNYQRRMKENPEKEYEDRKKWKFENRDKVKIYMKKYHKNRYATNINYKLACLLRGNANRIIKKGCKKNCKTLKMLGCSVQFVRDWLKSQFDEHMTWKNHGSYWHMDHFFPVACFDLTKPEEQNKCFHWSNLQPLEGRANLRKGCKIPLDEEIENHLYKIESYNKLHKRDEKSILPFSLGSENGETVSILDDKILINNITI